MENQVTTNKEVIEEVSEEVVSTSSRKAAVVAVGIGVTVLAGGIVYKYIVKPIVAKIKAKKEQKKSIKEKEDDEIICPIFDDEEVESFDSKK